VPPTIIRNTQYITNSVNVGTTVHRVVTGYAKQALSPNFYDNDWDSERGYTSGGGFRGLLSTAEKNYLKSVKNLRNKTTYYIDLTGRTVRTSNFSDYSAEVGRSSSSRETSRQVGNTIYITTTVTTTIKYQKHDYQVIARVFDNSPLVLDLNFDNKLDVSHNEWRPHAPTFYGEFAKYFDITGDGAPDFTEWVSTSQRDGVLVRPENGKVENALQLFGTAGGYTDGFEKLSIVCDSDKNGWVEGAELNGLFLWIDANHDATCQSEEMHPLAKYGIKRLSTKHSTWVGQFETTDGKQHIMWDWWPAAMEVRKVRTSDE
jgi:hypothetical protein